jgi:hypothetical protein
MKSKKRKHPHSIEGVGRSDNAVGDWQQCADAEGNVDNIFATTKDNPAATHGRYIQARHFTPCIAAALANGDDEKHSEKSSGSQCDSAPTPNGDDEKHSEEQRVAMRLGTNS